MRGSLVRLVPLASEHVQPLLDAAGRRRSSFSFTLVPADRAAMQGYVDAALVEHGAGRDIPFAVLDTRTGTVLGTTRFTNVERWPGNDLQPMTTVAEIGYTWLAADAQGTGANTEAKLLLLDHAFVELDMARVAFMTDARNIRSRRAIEKIGATFEGVRRAHMPAFDGGIRDSAFYSVLRAEWAALRIGLVERLRGMAG